MTLREMHKIRIKIFFLNGVSLYIDFNRLEKNTWNAYFLHFAHCYFICTYFIIFFRFSVFLGQLLRCGHIVPTPKPNWVKNGLFLLFAKK